jgi:RRXRR protein
MHKNQRIPVQYPDGTTAMPTQFYRAEKWVEQGKAEWIYNDLRIKQVRLRTEPLKRNVQPIAIGVDPGKYYSGVGVQSSKATLFLAHLELPFPKVKKRMEQRATMRRTRRSRRINRTVEFKLRNHRQKRFSNRTQKKVPPSIRANRQVELRVVTELSRLFPISEIVYEYVKAKTLPGCSFSPVQVGQKWAIEQLNKIAPVRTLFGWQTATLRDHLNLYKSKKKSEQSPASHAVDGVALAASSFVFYRSFNGFKEHGHQWVGSVRIAKAQFVIVKRLPICRRQLHLLQPAKGGIRRAYGGTVTRHASLRKGDLVQAEQAGRFSIGWVSGDTAKQVSVSDFDWKRIGQFTASKVTLILRSTGILVNCPQSLSVVGASNP